MQQSNSGRACVLQQTCQLELPAVRVSGRLGTAQIAMWIPLAVRQRVAGARGMLRQFVFGAAVCVCNIAIHALVMTAVVQVAQIVGAKTTLRPTLVLIAVMVATVSVFMV